MYGYTQEEAIGQPITLIVPSDRQEEISQILEELKGGEPIRNFETICMKKGGAEVDSTRTRA